MVTNLPEMQEMHVQSLGWKDSLGERNGNPLQYSCLENFMDRGTWWATVHGLQRIRHDWVDWAHSHRQEPLTWFHLLLSWSSESSACWPTQTLPLPDPIGISLWLLYLHPQTYMKPKEMITGPLIFISASYFNINLFRLPGLRQGCVAHNEPPDPLSKFLINPRACVAQLRFNAVK